MSSCCAAAAEHEAPLPTKPIERCSGGDCDPKATCMCGSKTLVDQPHPPVPLVEADGRIIAATPADKAHTPGHLARLKKPPRSLTTA